MFGNLPCFFFLRKLKFHSFELYLTIVKYSFFLLEVIPNTILPFNKNTKGCKDVHNFRKINKQKRVTSVDKWKEEGNNFTDLEWNQTFELPFKTTLETKISPQNSGWDSDIQPSAFGANAAVNKHELM